jgi:quinol monooxygenase YgiN
LILITGCRIVRRGYYYFIHWRENMARIGIMVHYKVKPGMRDKVIAAAEGHVGRVKANEPGCMQFDIMLPKNHDDDVCLYEVYADAAAFKAHTQSSYIGQVQEEMKPLLDDRTLTICEIQD